MKVFDFIYYRFYRVSKWIALRDPEKSPMFLIPFLLVSDIAYILVLSGFTTTSIKTYCILGLITYFALYFILYLIFSLKKRYLFTVERFKNESKTKDIILNILTLLYIGITMQGALISAIILSK